MKEGGGEGEGTPPRLLAPFFAWPLLQNSTETLASQAIVSWPVMTNDKLLRYHFQQCKRL